MSACVSTVCPSDMVYVNKSAQNVSVCVDKYEFTRRVNGKNIVQLKPAGNINYYQCQNYCKQQGKRLLSHVEWVSACEGTDHSKCNKFRAHPVLRKVQSDHPWKYKNIDCKNEKNMWGSCLNDLRLNDLSLGLASNGDFKKCLSKFGIAHMIGNLGEWVKDLHKYKGQTRGRFNGGLYPQKKSSCRYTTIAHGPRYRDYSIGCRCGQNPGYKMTIWSELL